MINKTTPFIIRINGNDFHRQCTLAMTVSWLHKFWGQLNDAIEFDFCKGACWLSITVGSFTSGNITKASLVHGVLASGGVKRLTVLPLAAWNMATINMLVAIRVSAHLTWLMSVRCENIVYNTHWSSSQPQSAACCGSWFLGIMDTSNHFWTFSSHEVCGECLEDKQAAKESFPTLIVDTISRYITRV